MAPVGSDRPDPHRRGVLAAGLAGITTTVLPAAAAAATGSSELQGFSAPTGVAAVPIGYVSDAATGAIRVSWDAVEDATGYEVDLTLGDTTVTVVVAGGSTTTTDMTSLDGVDLTYDVIVRAVAGPTRSGDSTEVTTSAVIADGGTVTTLEGTPTYVLHTFPYDDGTAADFTLRRTIDLDYLLVGGGGGGGGGNITYTTAGGGGGGGGVAAGTIADAVGSFTVTVGGGGDGLPNDVGANPADPGGDTVLSDGVTPVVAGGGDGGERGRLDKDYQLGGAGGVSGTPAENAAGGRVLNHGAGGGGAGSVGTSGSGGGGTGGAGTSSSITGSAILYGGGGGGGTPNGTAGVAGTGGGGTGGRNNGSGTSQAAATTGTDGRGGGGGGGNSGSGSTPTNREGARGGHGIAILRYALP